MWQHFISLLNVSRRPLHEDAILVTINHTDALPREPVKQQKSRRTLDRVQRHQVAGQLDVCR